VVSAPAGPAESTDGASAIPARSERTNSPTDASARAVPRRIDRRDDESDADGEDGDDSSSGRSEGIAFERQTDRNNFAAVGFPIIHPSVDVERVLLPGRHPPV
jgi:hypothetical protein